MLDGIHRLAPGTLSIVQRLIQERELNLPDGSYLMRSERYDALARQIAKSDDAGESNKKPNIFQIRKYRTSL